MLFAAGASDRDSAAPLMVRPHPCFCWFASLLVAAGCAFAQPLLPPEPLRLETLAEFKNPTANWQIAGGLDGNPRRDKTLVPAPGSGVLVNTPRVGARGHLFTVWEHGDLELDLDFLLPPGANSGIYLQGRYEIQLMDSWGVREPKSGDNGGIYHRWDPARGKGKEGYDGHAPRANASRAPGLWQHLHVAFEAPRFDAAGKKTRNARFKRVTLNGFVIHENVEVSGPTRSPAFAEEGATGPLMIQGDHGALALRSIAVKRFASPPLAVEDLRYKLHAGEFKRIGEYDNLPPTSEGALQRFAHTAVEKSGKFGLVFTGALVVPRDGRYAFTIESTGNVRLLIDDRPVVIPLEKGSHPGAVTLKAGRHPFRLDLLQTAGRPSLELIAEGPGLPPQALTARAEKGSPTSAAKTGIAVEPKDRVLTQRSFVPFEPKKRLYALNVGTPAGAHFSYDFETGALLRAWRGNFLDAVEMWEARGSSQLGKPTGPALTFNAKPLVAAIESAQSGNWPDQPDALWSSNGYTLEPDGLPVFLSSFSGITVRDRIAPVADGRGLTRTIELNAVKLPDWSTWVLLAEAATITPQPDGAGWIIGDREWYLDWPADSRVRPVLRDRGGRQQLAAPVVRSTLGQPITYSIVW